ncbi:MAG: capsular biosynthesis protein [Bacilli bacterium]|nr:capsular biosynthesis protein [Bacilli bacterium]
MNTLIFDIDSTICPAKKTNERYEDLIPYKKMIDKITMYKNKGYKIVLFTSRNMRTYEGDLDKILKYTKPILEKWLKKWNIPYDEVIYGKPWPGKDGFYIDDRAIRPKEFLENDLDDLAKICNIDKNLNEMGEII